MQNLNQRILHGVPIPVCTTDEQNQIVSQLDTAFSAIDYLDQTIEQALARAAALWHAILKNAITGVLAPVMSDLIVAQGFDGEGKSYYPGGAQNTLTQTVALRGYWLKLNSAATLVVTGTQPVTTTVHLQPGWNLIGYLPDTALARDVALASIAGQYTALLGFDQGAESWYAALPDSMNTLTMMYPNRGYWIYMTEAADLVYP